MLNLIESTNTAATQRVDVNGTSELVVGVSLPGVQAEYFDVFSLEDLATELRSLGLVLLTVALVTTIAGAAVGRLAAGRVLLPLVSVSQAAETIAGGRLDTRLEAVGDADLATLASSFNRMADALQERIRHEARFTSDVSHELRSPLTTLSNALGVLDSHRSDLDPRGRRALELLDIEVRRFQRMVDDLLEISRMDAGSAELLLDEVEVGELVRQAAASTGAGAVPVDVAPSTVGVRLLVDKRRIERVVANLVENAAQSAGGATRLAVEPAPGAVRIVVADHGPGVPAVRTHQGVRPLLQGSDLRSEGGHQRDGARSGPSSRTRPSPRWTAYGSKTGRGPRTGSSSSSHCPTRTSCTASTRTMHTALDHSIAAHNRATRPRKMATTQMAATRAGAARRSRPRRAEGIRDNDLTYGIGPGKAPRISAPRAAPSRDGGSPRFSPRSSHWRLSALFSRQHSLSAGSESRLTRRHTQSTRVMFHSAFSDTNHRVRQPLQFRTTPLPHRSSISSTPTAT